MKITGYEPKPQQSTNSNKPEDFPEATVVLNEDGSVDAHFPATDGYLNSKGNRIYGAFSAPLTLPGSDVKAADGNGWPIKASMSVYAVAPKK